MGSRPQVDWVCDDNGRCLVDCAGRFEDLNSARATISDRIGVPLQELGRHNPSAEQRPLPASVAREGDYDYLHRLHERDFELFGYDPALRFPPAST